MPLRSSALVLFTIVVGGACSRGPAASPDHSQPANVDTVAPLASADQLAKPIAKGELLYVPAYSSIYTTSAERTMALTVTLSVRNVDPERSILLRSAKYYDTTGKPLAEVVPKPRVLPPLATFDHVVNIDESRGGTGANFLVEWVTDDAAALAPLVETINMQTLSGQGVSFTSRAVVVRALGADRPPSSSSSSTTSTPP